MNKPNRRKRVNADRLRFAILTELPKYEGFKNLHYLERDDIIQFIIMQIDRCTEGEGDLHGN